MLRRAVLSVSLLWSLSPIPSLAQAPNASTPFDVKEGLWDLTQTSYNILQADWLDKLPPEVTAEQRAQMIEAQKDPRSHATAEKWAICLTREKLDQADITRHGSGCTSIRVDSTGASIARHSVCQGIAQEAEFERIDAETFKGTEITFLPSDRIEGHMEIAAKWAGADCAGIKKSRAYAAGLAAGVDPDILSFLPFRLPHSDDGLERFGPFKIFWKETGGVPWLVYHSGVPGTPEGAAATWLAGTDGEYLYVVLHHDPDTCRDPTALNFRLDHSGTMTRVGLLPPNLHGGKGAPCGQDGPNP